MWRQMDKKAEKTYLGIVTLKEKILDSFIDYDDHCISSKDSCPR